MKTKGEEILNILESNQFIKPTYAQRRDLLSILEAGSKAEKELDLDDMEEELEDNTTGGKKKPAAKKETDTDEKDNLDDGDENTKQIKAEAVNTAGVGIKILMKVYSRILERMNGNAVNMEAINNSKGDIRKLGVLYKDKTYYEVFKTILDTHRAVAESFSGDESKYFGMFEKFLNDTEKYTPKFKKAFSKKKDNLVKCVYITAVMYLTEMATILAAETVHIFNKGEKDFDKLLEKTSKDYVSIFNAADGFYKADGSDVAKFMTQDIQISEAAIHEWHNNVDDLSALDPELLAISESMMPTKTNAIGLAHIAKLLKYGLAVTMYRLFSVMRYIIYLVYYQKFALQKKITLIAASLDLINNDGDNNLREQQRSIATQTSVEYRADTIIASNRSTVDISTNEEDGATTSF